MLPACQWGLGYKGVVGGYTTTRTFHNMHTDACRMLQQEHARLQCRQCWLQKILRKHPQGCRNSCTEIPRRVIECHLNQKLPRQVRLGRTVCHTMQRLLEVFRNRLAPQKSRALSDTLFLHILFLKPTSTGIYTGRPNEGFLCRGIRDKKIQNIQNPQA